MQLSDHGASVQAALALRYGISPDAVRAMMEAIRRGGGQQAQFSHPDLGGMGQWQRGGMIMVGDMFNTNLQALVANLCNDLSSALAEGDFFKAEPGSHSGNWWPVELGHPSSTGMQNTQGYAIFPDAARLAILSNGKVRVYDTGAHRIGGVGQQQSQDGSVTFTSQFGSVSLASLAEVTPENTSAKHEQTDTPASSAVQPASPVETAPAAPSAPQAAANDVYEALSKLGALRDQGILTDEEFQAKKTELLARI